MGNATLVIDCTGHRPLNSHVLRITTFKSPECKGMDYKPLIHHRWSYSVDCLAMVK